MYAILGLIKVKPEHLNEFVAHVGAHARHSRQEPGCLRFDVWQDRDDAHTICLFEVFRTEADLAAHRAQDYYRTWMSVSRDWRDQTAYSRRVLDVVDVE